MIRLHRDEVAAALDSDPELVARYAAAHNLSVDVTRDVILDFVPVIDASRYGPGGMLGHIRRAVARLEQQP